MNSSSDKSFSNGLMQFVMFSTRNHLLTSSIKPGSVTFSKSGKLKVEIGIILAASSGIGETHYTVFR